MKLKVRNASGEILVGVLHKHCPDEDSREVVVLCHGLLDYKDDGIVKFLSKNLPFNTYRFDFSGTGESGGDFSFGNYDKQVEDLRNVISMLQDLGWRIKCVVGHAKGGNVALLYAAKYNSPPVANLGARFDMSRVSHNRFWADQLALLRTDGWFDWQPTSQVCVRVTAAAFDEARSVDMATAATRIRAPVLTLHGSADTIIPVQDARNFEKVIRNNTTVVIEHAPHLFVAHEHQVLRNLIRFLFSLPAVTT